MIYGDDPTQIILVNRTQAPTLENLKAQVTSLARAMVDLRIDQVTSEQVAAAVANGTFRPTLQAIERTLDTDFVISTERDTLAFYTVETVVTASALGLTTTTADVQLVIDGVASGETQHNMSVTLGLSTSATHTHRKVLTGYVPRGATVNLTSSGTGTKTLISSVEILL